MNEGEINPLDALLTVTSEQLKEESEVERRGVRPERHRQILDLEERRMLSEIETTLQERLKGLKPEELEQRRATVRKYILELMDPSSSENGGYAARKWNNFHELMRKVIDWEADAALVPDADPRVPSPQHSRFDKEHIVQKALTDRIKDALGEEHALTTNQWDDCFANIKPAQMNIIVDQITYSGVSLFPESPDEHWARLMREQQAARTG